MAKLHVLARLYHWIEHDKIRAYLMLTCAYRDQEEYLKFFDDNKALRLTGNTEEKTLGFHSGCRSDSVGIQNLFNGFSGKSDETDECDNPDEESNR